MLENSNVFLAPVHSYLKTLVLFLHATTVPEATGEKMAPKPETNVGCAIIITTGKKRYSRLSGGCVIIITTGKKKF